MIEYLKEDSLERIMASTNRNQIKRIIEENIYKHFEKNIKTELLEELIYSTVKFCKNSRFDYKQSEIVLSIFNTTNAFFLKSSTLRPDDVYEFFKENLLQYCLTPSPKDKFFSLKQTRNILCFFSRIYLKNLPIIQYLCQPTLGYCINHKIEPEKGGKGKKDKKGKGKK